MIGDGNATGDFKTTGDQKGVTDPSSFTAKQRRLHQHPRSPDGLPGNKHGQHHPRSRSARRLPSEGGSRRLGAFELEIVDPATVASVKSIMTNEDTAKAITLTATDAYGDSLAYSVVWRPTDGTLSGTGATRNYTPNANYNGPDSSTFKANDGTADANTATVSITVTAVDDYPVAVNDNKTVAEDDPATTIDVLSNDTDVDGGTKSFQSVTQPAHGTAAITNNGADLTYNPNADYCNGGSLTDDFNYTLNGGSTAGSQLPSRASTMYRRRTPSRLLRTKTLPRRSPSPAPTPTATLAYSIDTVPSHGTLSGTDANQIYTPNANDNGPDSFDYTVSDGKGDTDTANINVRCRR